MQIDSNSSVTIYIQCLQEGESKASVELWNHFYSRLVVLARKKLKSKVRRVIDEEDIALEALENCFTALKAGHFPDIRDRDNLWALLATITERRALNANRNEYRSKRGGGHIRGDSAFLRKDDSICVGPDAMPSAEPTPEMVAAFTEDFEYLLSRLRPNLQHIAKFKLEGYTNREIGEKVECSIATVERKLKLIRETWQRDLLENTPSQ
ncbi:ECF-type sigma factor [uncultured Rubinisphaera sp.]|uniref:ECF-type sigma factor n=1 Tax=uncultured Rubinisphaera sp. TaxID=1678686 RepID=UPI0030DA764D